MRRSKMTLLTGLVATAGFVAIGSPAGADPDNDNGLPFTMTCPDGTYDVVVPPANTAAFHRLGLDRALRVEADRIHDPRR